MQIRKTYHEVNPELLFAEIRDFILEQGASLSESRMETYTLPDESASFISRGTLAFKANPEEENPCLRAHIVGMVRKETKLKISVDEGCFPDEKIKALQQDIDFVFSAYEEEKE